MYCFNKFKDILSRVIGIIADDYRIKTNWQFVPAVTETISGLE